MPRTPSETRQLFDRWALSYDESARRGPGPLAGYDASLHEAAASVPVAAGDAILDIGIGTGAFGGLLAWRGARIWGIDISPVMLERCQAEHPGFSLSEGSFLPIPHPDAMFDAVVSSFAFHEVAPVDRAEACRELARVLKDGGCVCLLDIMFASSAAVAEARDRLGRAWDDDEEYPLVGHLDLHLRSAGFTGLAWKQTGPLHWMVTGRVMRRG